MGVGKGQMSQEKYTPYTPLKPTSLGPGHSQVLRDDRVVCSGLRPSDAQTIAAILNEVDRIINGQEKRP